MKNIHLPLMEIVNPDGGKIEVPAFAVPSEAIDDSTITDQSAWSSKKTSDEIRQAKKEAIDSCAPLFHQKASVVQGALVKDYPLSIKTHIEPWQEGTGDPSPQNVRPIHGCTKLELTKCGVNLLTPKKNTFQPLRLKKGTNLYLKTKNGVPSLGGNVKFQTVTGADYWFAIDDGLTFVSMPLRDDVVGYYNLLAGDLEYMLYIGSVDIPFESYSAKDYTKQLPEEVFSGVYDWESGELKADTKKYVITGEEKFELNKDSTYYTSYIIWVNLGVTIRYDTLCNMLKTGILTSPYMINTAPNGPMYITLPKEEYPDISSAKKFFADKFAAGNPVYIVYKTNPVIAKLTPTTNILSLDGVTTLYSNTGDTEVVGRADSNAIIAQMQVDIAALQNAVVKS